MVPVLGSRVPTKHSVVWFDTKECTDNGKRLVGAKF